MKRIRRSACDQKGAAAVEFAIILPLLATFLFGVIEFGITLVRLENYTSTAREAARYASLKCPPATSCSSTAIRDYIVQIQNQDMPGANPIPAAISVSADCATATVPNTEVTVAWDQPISISLPLLSFSVTPHVSGSFRCE